MQAAFLPSLYFSPEAHVLATARNSKVGRVPHRHSTLSGSRRKSRKSHRKTRAVDDPNLPEYGENRLPAWLSARAAGSYIAPQLSRPSTSASRSVEFTSQMESVPLQIAALLHKNLTRVIDLFRSWDDDGDGHVDQDEFRRAIAALGYQFLQEEVDALYAAPAPPLVPAPAPAPASAASPVRLRLRPLCLRPKRRHAPALGAVVASLPP